MHFITWLYLIIETLHKLCTIIPRYIFIEEDFFQRKSKIKSEREIVPSYQYIKWNILKIDFGTWYNWLVFSKEPSTMAHHPSNQLTSLNRQQHSTLRVRSPQISMSSVRSPNSEVCTIKHIISLEYQGKWILHHQIIICT